MQSFGDSTNDLKKCAPTVEQGAQELLSQHSHFRGRAGDFKYEYRAGMLIVRGCVPTFYLKQVLQTVLKEVEGSSMDRQPSGRYLKRGYEQRAAQFMPLFRLRS